jgi:nitroreductase
MDSAYRPTPLTFERLALPDQMARLDAFGNRLLTRRTVRHYAAEDVPDSLIDRAIAIAGSAPSGANMQPWRFVVVRDPEVKRRIREAAVAFRRRSRSRGEAAYSGGSRRRRARVL